LAAASVLVVAATERELAAVPGPETLACGIGPVEGAAATARALAERRPPALLHVGIAGARGLAIGTTVIGTEAVYCDLAAAVPVVDRATPDEGLLDALRAAFPAFPALPIGTSARVGGTPASLRVEAMEGFAVLRAAELAGVPAVEVRVVANAIDEPDRARWRFDEALAVLAEQLQRLVAVVSAA
jgi:nucleoside phosphorylase